MADWRAGIPGEGTETRPFFMLARQDWLRQYAGGIKIWREQRLKKGWIAAGAAVVAVSVGLISYFSGGGQTVSTERATVGSVTVTVDVTGEVYPSVMYQASHPLGGKVADVAVKEGDTVSSGELLASMDVSAEEAQLESARAAIAQAEDLAEDAGGTSSLREAALAAAQSSACDFATFNAAVSSGETAVMPDNIDMPETQETMAASGELQGLEEILNSSEVKSEISGTVLSVSAAAGDTVTPGQAIAEIGDMDSLRIRVYVNEKDAARLAENMQATFTVEGAESMSGTVEQIGSKLVEEDGSKKCEVILRPEGALHCLPGSTADVSILLSSVENAVTIPIDAIVDGNAVYLAKEDGTMEKVFVSIGATNEEVAEVLSGVYAGDKVIVNPSEEWKDGEKYVEDSED